MSEESATHTFSLAHAETQTHISAGSTHTGGTMQLQASTDTEEKKMDPVQKAVINHTFGVPLVKTKRPVISCNVCQIRFNSESQAEAHYKGNRHARRVKGIETSKSRPQEGDKPHTVPPTTSPTPPGAPGTAPDSEPSKQGYNSERSVIALCLNAVSSLTLQLAEQVMSFTTLKGFVVIIAPKEEALSFGVFGPLQLETSNMEKEGVLILESNGMESTHNGIFIRDDAMEWPGQLCRCLLHNAQIVIQDSRGCSIVNANSEQLGSVPLVPGATGSPASSSPSNPETEEDKAKKLLYCSLCKVAVNSLSQLEAHNKGTKHKTILEARSGLGPIKAYPRLGPKPSGEQGGGPVDPNTQERTFHCEICNVRVNSELQLKQHISSRRHRDGMAGKPNPLLSRHKKHRGADLTSSLTFSKDLTKALGAGLLPNPLAVAAAMAAAASSNQLALRAAAPAHHPHHHLLQGPPLSHAILRPAPGPIRTTHGPILFSPY
ncbi:hypothetical protein PAMP_012029 [Pampus punctatissimus]